MRLLLVIDNLGSGGAQRQLVTLAVGLRQRGHDVELFVYQNFWHFADRVRAAGIPILHHPKPSRFSPRPVRDLRRLFRDGGYDAVLSYLSVPNLYCVLAGVGLRRRPAIVVSERLNAMTGGLAVRQFFIERLYRCADFITVNSFHLADHYRRRFHWMAPRLATIWNGVDTDEFTSTPLPPLDGPLKLLAIGRIVADKNWRQLIEALGLLKREFNLYPQVSLVGRLEGLQPVDVAYREEMLAALRAHDIEQQWTWLGERSDIANLLHAHHALIHPSLVEGLPNVVCEALSCGRPVLIGNVLDHPRLVADGVRGYLFDPHDPRSIADAIRRYAQLSPDQRHAMSHAARDFAETELANAKYIDAYESLLQRLCEARESSDK